MLLELGFKEAFSGGIPQGLKAKAPFLTRGAVVSQVIAMKWDFEGCEIMKPILS